MSSIAIRARNIAAPERKDYNDHMITNLRDAKAQLSMLVQRAAEGEEIIITVHGRPTARMTAVAPPPGSTVDARAWMHELALEADAARCGEVRATPQEHWDDVRAERG